jgi:hypothetical protein
MENIKVKDKKSKRKVELSISVDETYGTESPCIGFGTKERLLCRVVDEDKKVIFFVNGIPEGFTHEIRK